MKDWKELAVRIKKGKTIDNQELALLEAERMRWRAVLMLLTVIGAFSGSEKFGIEGEHRNVVHAI